MKGFFKKEKNSRLFSNLNIILASLVLAIGINILLIDGTNIGGKLKASVLNTTTAELKANLYIEKQQNEYYIVSDKDINNMETLSLSLIYNPDNVSILNFESSFGDVTSLSNTPGINSLILTTKDILGIKKGNKIIKLNLEKKEDKAENLNIMNANFRDFNDQHYKLSTSGITF